MLPILVPRLGIENEYTFTSLATLANKYMEKIKIEHHTLSGGLWIGAWLFTIGFLHLTFWKGVLAVVIWPYYLGVAFGGWVHI
ncbi:MAG: hypothetical protein G01um10148_513 [Parcubacteria group bacterium Gr01-1014_8]|nr:MAG: hypothetical protein G01um10148_513 [Parcubacteria group bacterium Gr01-1014_8]